MDFSLIDFRPCQVQDTGEEWSRLVRSAVDRMTIVDGAPPDATVHAHLAPCGALRARLSWRLPNGDARHMPLQMSDPGEPSEEVARKMAAQLLDGYRRDVAWGRRATKLAGELRSSDV